MLLLLLVVVVCEASRIIRYNIVRSIEDDWKDSLDCKTPHLERKREKVSQDQGAAVPSQTIAASLGGASIIKEVPIWRWQSAHSIGKVPIQLASTHSIGKEPIPLGKCLFNFRATKIGICGAPMLHQKNFLYLKNLLYKCFKII
jgi:hypothetical protein